MGKVNQFVVEADDLCDNVLTDPIYDPPLVEFLHTLKEETPALKMTFFTIPTRTSDATIKLFKEEFPWIALAPHGWCHSRGECLGWTSEEAAEKITLAKERGIDAPIFRAPGWLLDGETYEACRQLGYAVASHRTMRVPNTSVHEYVYNAHEGANPMRVKRVHGHVTPVSGNWLLDLKKMGRLTFKKDDEFVWPWEVATVINGVLE